MKNHPEYPERLSQNEIDNLSEGQYRSLVKSFLHANVKMNMEATRGIKWADSENVDINTLNQRKTFFGNSPGLKTFEEAKIEYDGKKKPLNPKRTGLAGRGLLGRWGANHAADPIVAYLDDNGDLWAIVVRRKDTGEWAIPGGMVDPGKIVTQTLRNEFQEEAADIDEKLLDKIFKLSILLYEGYVNDPRNTDNAWLETSVHGVLITPKEKNQIKLKDEDSEHNADSAKWMKICTNSKEFSNIYADHKTYLLLMKATVAGILFQQNVNNKCNIDKTDTDTGSDTESDWSDLSDMDTSTNVATNKKNTHSQKYRLTQHIDDTDIQILNKILVNILCAAALAAVIICAIIYLINNLFNKLFM